MDENMENLRKEDAGEDDIGFMLWKLESIENFLPCIQRNITTSRNPVSFFYPGYRRKNPLASIRKRDYCGR